MTPTHPQQLLARAPAPQHYIARRYDGGVPLRIDGDLDKEAWAGCEWSAPFDDIRGALDAPAGARPNARQRTRVKLMWDEQYLYIGALLEGDFETVATFVERNAPIFQRDSDFEVFIDAEGGCENYKELEVNALGTVWNLLLTRPYADGGAEHSGRVAARGAPDFYDAVQQRVATRVRAKSKG